MAATGVTDATLVQAPSLDDGTCTTNGTDGTEDAR